MPRLWLLLLVLLLGGIVWVWATLDLTPLTSVAGMRALIGRYGAYGPLVFIGVCVAGIFLRTPMLATVLIALGGVLFGGLEAFAYGWIASLVGTTGTFLLVRYVAHDYFQRTVGARLSRLRALDDRLERNSFWTVLGLRLVFVLAPALNWGLGVTRVRLHHYVAGTALGVLPGIGVAVFFADSITTRMAHGEVATALTPVLAGGLLMAVLVGAVLASRHLPRRMHDSQPG